MDDYTVFEQIALVTEFKNELGAGGKDPNVQNALYLLHGHWNVCKERLHPVMLLSAVGPHHLQAFDALFGHDNQALVGARVNIRHPFPSPSWHKMH